MLRHQEETTSTQASYVPVPRRDLMTDAHIEDYLDHRLAPLVGTVSYEERQEMRADLRQEIDSIVAAHVELGSAREQAIALALRSLAPAATETVAQSANRVQTTRTATPVSGTAMPLSLACFGAAAFASLILIALNSHANGSDVAVMLFLILTAFPVAAGALLGVSRRSAPWKGLVLGELALYLPVTLGFFLVTAGQGTPVPLWGLLVYTAIYTASSTLFGGFGMLAGGAVRDAIARLRRRD